MSGMQETILIPEMAPRPEQRPRKRRRRTMACLQCRSRKLKCDREYPTCGRCMKSKTPTKCTYEDGFLWQQPATIASSAFSERAERASAGATISRPSGIAVDCCSSADGDNAHPVSGGPRGAGEAARGREKRSVFGNRSWCFQPDCCPTATM